MRTRCPACSTIFRVTSEQLRLRAGKVRCGHCQAVFNAFDELVSEANEPLIEVSPSREDGAQEQFVASDQALSREAEEPLPEVPLADWAEDLPVEPADSPAVELSVSEEPGQPDAAGHEALPATAVELLPDVETILIQAPLAEPLVESAEESTQAARQAGLVAARELGDTASFNRWSAGTLASDGLGGFAGDSNRRPLWPFVIVTVLLFIGLLGQLFFYFRTDIVQRFPAIAPLYELVSVDIPLPRNVTLVSIETSDLQSDNAHGLFVLQATLKNRAGYAQAWPALELSLTDTNDAVVSRRIIFAADYLPPGTTSDAFPANAEMAIKLWVESKDSGASGYRLYIFYP